MAIKRIFKNVNLPLKMGILKSTSNVVPEVLCTYTVQCTVYVHFLNLRKHSFYTRRHSVKTNFFHRNLVKPYEPIQSNPTA
jgi:hypothetical protein